MFDVTRFLMRWVFLSNLARDITEIQTLPQQPLAHTPVLPREETFPQQQQQQQQQQPASSWLPGPPPPYPQHHHIQQQPPRVPVTQSSTEPYDEDLWRDACLREILSYPASSAQRCLIIDAMRCDLVNQLSIELDQADQVMKENRCAAPSITAAVASRSSSSAGERHQFVGAHLSEDVDPYLEADFEIVRKFESDDKIMLKADGSQEPQGSEERTTEDEIGQATLIISEDALDVGDGHAMPSTGSVSEPAIAAESKPVPPPEHVQQATRNLRHVREFLPQLISAVLHSPPPLDPDASPPHHPIQRLRQLIVDRCLKDPSWGIEICWLLEAEVGRTWKTLFEHRQQTGRRLIVVLPAERAAVLAKIGTQKIGAFELLQDAEQATAYGYINSISPSGEYNQNPSRIPEPNHGNEYHHASFRLPTSLSLRRCSHFGDTMHFIDRLTKISLDLRSVATSQRDAALKESLHEMNRRLRRRMVTRGEISLDVEDLRHPTDWPQLGDLSLDMLKHSVHFPLVPQTGVWPTGDPQDSNTLPIPQVVRVLNIVVEESRLLASRERCPFLVRIEVADTGLDGSDARLYASGGSRIGSTVQEALHLSAAASAASAASRGWNWGSPGGPPIYDIPQELFSHEPLNMASHQRTTSVEINEQRFPRGGWQSDSDELHQYQESQVYAYTDPYSALRQQEYEQLHQHLHSQSAPSSNTLLSVLRPHVSVGSVLLDKVFGKPWAERCREIRQLSPFGHVDGWRLASFIMKAGEDIRREALVMQIISKLRGWFETEISAEYRPFLRPYTILTVGGDAGLLECLSDCKSVDEVKKRTDGFASLREYFERAYGRPRRRGERKREGAHLDKEPNVISFEKAQDNFLRSLVGYSLVCFILQIKDRHNANIMLDREGHVMHIDFGYVLGDTPKMGKVPLFSERAPFKLSTDFWEVLGGWNINEGGLGVRFCKAFELAFACASSHADEIATLVEATVLTLNSNPRTARALANQVRSRLRMRGPPGSDQQKMFIVDLVNAAATSWHTSTYDWLQRNMNGYQ